MNEVQALPVLSALQSWLEIRHRFDICYYNPVTHTIHIRRPVLNDAALVVQEALLETRQVAASITHGTINGQTFIDIRF